MQSNLRKRIGSALLAAVLLLGLLPATAWAEETSVGTLQNENDTNTMSDTIDFAEFLDNVVKAGYTYDGAGVTVRWSPQSACTYTAHESDRTECLFPESVERPAANGNTPQRVQEPNAQYQIFSGQTNVSISNVNFVYVPADYTLCANSGWKGTTTAEKTRNAEFQLLNTGDVTFSNCTFDKVIVSPFSSATTTTFTNCDFANVYNAYAIKDVNAPALTVDDCAFTNCSGGIYLEHNVVRTKVAITDNTFTDMDQYAASGKENTRGLIQFSAGSGDYTNAVITISNNTSTDSAYILRQLNPTISRDTIVGILEAGGNSFTGAEVFTSDSLTANVVLPDETISWEENTVFDGTSYYPTMDAALDGIHQKGIHTLWCKPGANVGAMTHGHVCADLTIYGNGAYVSSGEHDFELDTYDDEAGHTVGEFLTQDVGLTIYDLNGCAVWSQRNSAHTLNITLENCKNMNRVYLSGTSGTNNITLKNCSFDGTRTDALKAGSCTIYSNASGSITVENCTFTGVKEGINLNHEVTGGGTQTITVTNCAFTDCSTTDICVDDKLYAAPIRIVSKYNATSNLTVENCTFTYSDGKETCNGDILLGEGRVNKVSTPVTATLINTAVQIQIQNPGDRTEEQNKGRQIQVAASAEPTTISSAVAQIGEQKYATLAAALEAAGAMSGDVTVTLLADVDVSGSAVRAYDLSASALTGLTIRGASKDVQIISGVDGNNIDGPTYCPVLTVKLPGEGTFTVENLTFPDDLLFDGASENSVVVQNCVFNGSQSGYPKAKSIFYLNNLFEFKGTAGSFYTNNAYPVWYKSERDQSIVFNGNTVKGYRGVHIETRADDASGHKVNIEVNNNRFELTDTEYENKEVALQLVRAVNGNISFQNNYVDGYMAVCFFKDIKYFDGTATIQNNYLVGNCKLYGSSEWNADGATPEEKENNADSFAQAFLASMGANGTVSEGHTHNYVNGVCTICGQSQPSSGGGSSSGSSGNKTETTTNPDGSTTTTVTKPDGTVTETTTNTDGSKEVVETKKDGTVTTTVTDKAGNKTETVEKTDGSSTTTVDNKDGSSSTTSVSKDGQVEAEVNLPASVVDNAQEEGEPVALPMPEVPVTTDKDSAPTVTVDLPANTTAKVEIPVEDVTYGTVAIRVKADGTEEIIKTTLTTENGVAVTLADGETVKIVDNAKDFDDVSDAYWGSSFVDFATSRGLFSGTSTTTFSPDLAMNRAMIVTVLAAYDGADTTAAVGDHWYSAGQQWAMENGVSDGTNMEGTLTREQLAVMLWSYAGRPEASTSLSRYDDADSVSAWAADAMTWAVENGLISGSDNNELLPQGQATRVQVATILMRFVEATNS